jgi:protein-tyrosine phosphatase
MITELWQKVRRRLARAHQRRRMRRAARRPGNLAARVAGARTILFVCHGNIIRSAFAAELMRSRSLGRAPLRVRSAGLAARANGPAHPTAIECAREFGVDLSAHRTHRLDRKDIDEADLLLAMETDHILELHRRFPESRDKAYLLGCFTNEHRLDVADPVNLPREVFASCFARIERSVGRVIEMVPRAMPSPVAGKVE